MDTAGLLRRIGGGTWDTAARAAGLSEVRTASAALAVKAAANATTHTAAPSRWATERLGALARLGELALVASGPDASGVVMESSVGNQVAI